MCCEITSKRFRIDYIFVFAALLYISSNVLKLVASSEQELEYCFLPDEGGTCKSLSLKSKRYVVLEGFIII